MPYLVLKQVSLPGGDRVVRFVAPGEVLADHEIPKFIQNNLRAGARRYGELLREISDEEARALGAELTAPEPRPAPDPGAIHPSELLWEGSSPGDKEHAMDLERRVSALETAQTNRTDGN